MVKVSRYSLTRIIDGYLSARKGQFTIRLIQCNDRNLTHYIHIKNNSITVNSIAYNPDTGNASDTVSVVSSVTELPLPYNVHYDIDFISEKIMSSTGELYTESKYIALDLLQVYLPLFRVFGEQVVFIYKTNQGEFLKCYFVNGRVFYTKNIDGGIELHQLNLRQLVYSLPGEIIAFEKLPKKISYKTIFTVVTNYAKSKGLELKVYKSGVYVMEGGSNAKNKKF